jgi:hypothetical protein
MKRLLNPKKGQYVLVTKFRTLDPKAPWCISFIEDVIQIKERFYYKVKGSIKYWPYCFSLRLQEGQQWLKQYASG